MNLIGVVKKILNCSLLKRQIFLNLFNFLKIKKLIFINIKLIFLNTIILMKKSWHRDPDISLDSLRNLRSFNIPKNLAKFPQVILSDL